MKLRVISLGAGVAMTQTARAMAATKCYRRPYYQLRRPLRWDVAKFGPHELVSVPGWIIGACYVSKRCGRRVWIPNLPKPSDIDGEITVFYEPD